MLKFKTKPKVSDDQIEQLAVAAKTAPLSPYADLVDQVGALTEEAAPIVAEIAALQAKLQPLAEKKAELQAVFDGMGADEEPLRLNGAIFRAEAGKRGTSRTIKDMALVRKFLGVETFMQVAAVKLGDLDKYLNGAQKDQVVTTSRTARTVKIMRLP